MPWLYPLREEQQIGAIRRRKKTYSRGVPYIKTRTEVLEILPSRKSEVRERYYVESIAIFGSYAREEQVESSDIDVLVEFGSGAVLFDFVGLSQYLEERPGSRVDVVPAAALRRPEIRGHVVRDLLFA